jgi:hypothetical protein
MLGSNIFAAIVGAGLKLIFMVISSHFENKRELNMANSHANDIRVAAIKEIQSDNRSNAHWVRPIIAFSIIGTFCFIMIYYTLHSDTEYTVFIDKDRSIWKAIFGGKNFEERIVKGVQLTKPFWDLVFMVASFYFVGHKNGK